MTILRNTILHNASLYVTIPRVYRIRYPAKAQLFLPVLPILVCYPAKVHLFFAETAYRVVISGNRCTFAFQPPSQRLIRTNNCTLAFGMLGNYSPELMAGPLPDFAGEPHPLPNA